MGKGMYFVSRLRPETWALVNQYQPVDILAAEEMTCRPDKSGMYMDRYGVGWIFQLVIDPTGHYYRVWAAADIYPLQ